jgi:hypothetical protein
MDETYSTHGRNEKCYKILTEEPIVKKSLGRYRRKWENITIDIKEYVDWTHLALNKGPVAIS